MVRDELPTLKGSATKKIILQGILDKVSGDIDPGGVCNLDHHEMLIVMNKIGIAAMRACLKDRGGTGHGEEQHPNQFRSQRCVRSTAVALRSCVPVVLLRCPLSSAPLRCTAVACTDVRSHGPVRLCSHGPA